MSWLGQGVDRAGKIAWIVALALLVIAPFVGVYPIFIAQALCFAIFAMAFNLLLGYTGLLSFGHAAFFGGAAYITAWLLQEKHVTPEVALLGGVAAAGLTGLVIGAIAIRRQGIYFAMVTLALAYMLSFFFLEASFTGGENGIQGVERGRLFGMIPLDNDLSLYFFVLLVFVGIFALVLRIVHSPYGQVLKAIRENEPRAISLGYNVDRYKLLAFVLSASIAGLGGALKVLVLHLATLQDVRWEQSGEVILMTLLGGLGTFAGPVVGAFIVIGLQNFLSDRAGSWTGVIIGCIFVACVVAFRKGVVGELLAWHKRRTKKA
ncbi:branched-chain amino acid ABC transporter permease [Scleromatobacter humisilvae]|uniref:Branched-chain amino acid ABC transporter permease n=1 Tax=Scleromatobacter humisilvae TaxID=2897159 RepID=A0A9X1YIV5_9BURK|nr:branched-chain amino acid ABC transporter permease [Scleromatobacter humisilvae]MCK9685207.1 branched-chain amino acid ABC transporter permease [Scleromatobacter humisilvae]